MIPRMVILAHCISIHALREEGDLRLTPRPPRYAQYFYPRPPRGGRLASCFSVHCIQKFLSTPSARRATEGDILNPQRFDISIHALREEGDK